MNTGTQTAELSQGHPTLDLTPGYFARRNAWDWLYALLVTVGGAYALFLYGGYMDGYEKGILVAAVPSLIGLAWFWRPVRTLTLVVGLLALLAIWLYQVGGQPQLARAEQVFLLKYFLSSQSAILWMSVLFFMGTAFYWVGMLSRQPADVFEKLGSRLVWVAVTLALVGTLVRWYESYLIGPDVGHIPVSNLYEVFVLFAWLTAAYYLYYEDRYQTRRMGAFVMLVVSAAVGFLLWYTVVREAHQIQPLVPALQSWWMKLHVPANFIGHAGVCLPDQAVRRGTPLVQVAAPVAVGRGAVLRTHCVPAKRCRRFGQLLVCVFRGLCLDRGHHPDGAPPHCRAPAQPGGAGRRDVQSHCRGFCLLHHCHRAGGLVGRRGLGWLLELGPEGNLGTHCLVELRGLVAYAVDEGFAWHRGGLVGAGGPGRDHVRVPGGEHVPQRPAQLWRIVKTENSLWGK